MTPIAEGTPAEANIPSDNPIPRRAIIAAAAEWTEIPSGPAYFDRPM